MTQFTRKTLNTAVAIEGNGLHSGIYTCLELKPALAGTGIRFVRPDLGDLVIPVAQESTTALDHATSVGIDDVSIGTIEHLLSAVIASGVTDLDLHIDGPEVPIIDGSSLPFVHLIEAAGIRDLGIGIEPLRVIDPVVIEDGDRWIRVDPAEELCFDYTIDFAHPAIGRQRIDFTMDYEAYVREIAPARTFGFLSDVEKLRAVGLARGGTVENCIVLDDQGVMNGPLRFADEFVRHKIVDLLGDLVLLNRPVLGRITAWKAGHALHSRLVAALIEGEEKPAAATRADRNHEAIQPS